MKEKKTIFEIVQQIKEEKGVVTVQDLEDAGITVHIDLCREEDIH